MALTNAERQARWRARQRFGMSDDLVGYSPYSTQSQPSEAAMPSGSGLGWGWILVIILGIGIGIWWLIRRLRGSDDPTE